MLIFYVSTKSLCIFGTSLVIIDKPSCISLVVHYFDSRADLLLLSKPHTAIVKYFNIKLMKRTRAENALIKIKSIILPKQNILLNILSHTQIPYNTISIPITIDNIPPSMKTIIINIHS